MSYNIDQSLDDIIKQQRKKKVKGQGKQQQGGQGGGGPGQNVNNRGARGGGGWRRGGRGRGGVGRQQGGGTMRQQGGGRGAPGGRRGRGGVNRRFQRDQQFYGVSKVKIFHGRIGKKQIGKNQLQGISPLNRSNAQKKQAVNSIKSRLGLKKTFVRQNKFGQQAKNILERAKNVQYRQKQQRQGAFLQMRGVQTKTNGNKQRQQKLKSDQMLFNKVKAKQNERLQRKERRWGAGNVKAARSGLLQISLDNVPQKSDVVVVMPRNQQPNRFKLKRNFGEPKGSFGQRNEGFGERKGSFGERKGSFGERKGSFGERKGSFGERKGSLAGGLQSDYFRGGSTTAEFSGSFNPRVTITQDVKPSPSKPADDDTGLPAHIKEQIHSLKPTVKQTFHFDKVDFCKGHTGKSLSERFGVRSNTSTSNSISTSPAASGSGIQGRQGWAALGSGNQGRQGWAALGSGIQDGPGRSASGSGNQGGRGRGKRSRGRRGGRGRGGSASDGSRTVFL